LALVSSSSPLPRSTLSWSYPISSKRAVLVAECVGQVGRGARVQVIELDRKAAVSDEDATEAGGRVHRRGARDEGRILQRAPIAVAAGIGEGDHQQIGIGIDPRGVGHTAASFSRRNDPAGRRGYRGAGSMRHRAACYAGVDRDGIGSPSGTRGRMSDRAVRAALCVLAVCAVAVAAEAKAGTPAAPGAQDVVAFCRKHGTLDDPAQAFFGPGYRYGMLPKPLEGTMASDWRCMDGKVYVCENSASGDWCSKKDPSRKPAADIKEFCEDNPGSDAVTDALVMYSASHWKCDGRKAVIAETWALDKRGYMRKMWLRLVIENGVVVAPKDDDFGMR
jgi:hypothetical protein